MLTARGGTVAHSFPETCKLLILARRTLLGVFCWCAGQVPLAFASNYGIFKPDGTAARIDDRNAKWSAGVDKARLEGVQRVYVLDSRNRPQRVLKQIRVAVESEPGIQLEARRTEIDGWFEQIDALARQRPSVVVIHWHALRPLGAGKPGTQGFEDASRQSERDLLLGLVSLHGQSSDTRFVVYSDAFKVEPRSERAAEFTRSVRRLLSPGAQQMVLDRTLLLPWPNEGGNADVLADFLRPSLAR
jgi:hypothetical protein